jgi:hypothetical protein
MEPEHLRWNLEVVNIISANLKYHLSAVEEIESKVRRLYGRDAAPLFNRDPHKQAELTIT